MIGFYNYTVILTYIGALFGFGGVTYILNGNLKMALICLMVSGFCDMFDGKIASTMERTKQEKRFGVQIDSLSDLICFGVLPALIVYQSSDSGFLSLCITAVYVLSALIRLAWFNVDEEQRQELEEKSREEYRGLPVTTAAMLIPFFMGTAQIVNLSTNVLCPGILLPMAIAFLSPFNLRKPGTKGSLIMTLCGVATLILVLVGVKG